ncbi:MAG: signal peptidase II [Clostridia bacterium]|nr:signal peptidase II [Clostridia bacterium]MDY3785382.1 signal peptidase II [Eubacteriales bacterium]
MLVMILLIIAFIYLDQLSKYLAVIYLKGGESFPIIKNVLHLTYVENEGAAFGMLKDHRWIFMIISSVAIIGLFVYLVKNYKASRLQSVALTMIIAGGIGNMIDRVVLGYVVDFIDFTLINFAIFNVADSFVCVGVGLLIIYLLMTLKREHDAEKASKSADTGTPAADNPSAGATVSGESKADIPTEDGQLQKKETDKEKEQE